MKICHLLVGSLLWACTFGVRESFGIGLWESSSYGRCKTQLMEIFLKTPEVSRELIESHRWLAVPFDNSDGKFTMGHSLALEKDGGHLDLYVKGDKLHISIETVNKISHSIVKRDCTLESHESSPVFYGKNQNGNDIFSDLDLQKLISNSKAGAIYLWSPHMPLSIGVLKHIEQACKKNSVALTVLLDPSADKNEVLEAIKKARSKGVTNIIPSYLKRNLSRTLGRNGSYLHYPNLILYKDGKILRGNLFGAKSPELYTRFIQNNLGRM